MLPLGIGNIATGFIQGARQRQQDEMTKENQKIKRMLAEQQIKVNQQNLQLGEIKLTQALQELERLKKQQFKNDLYSALDNYNAALKKGVVTTEPINEVVKSYPDMFQRLFGTRIVRFEEAQSNPEFIKKLNIPEEQASLFWVAVDESGNLIPVSKIDAQAMIGYLTKKEKDELASILTAYKLQEQKAKTEKMQAEAEKTRLETQIMPKEKEADIGLKGARADYYRALAEKIRKEMKEGKITKGQASSKWTTLAEQMGVPKDIAQQIIKYEQELFKAKKDAGLINIDDPQALSVDDLYNIRYEVYERIKGQYTNNPVVAEWYKLYAGIRDDVPAPSQQDPEMLKQSILQKYQQLIK